MVAVSDIKPDLFGGRAALAPDVGVTAAVAAKCGIRAKRGPRSRRP